MKYPKNFKMTSDNLKDCFAKLLYFAKDKITKVLMRHCKPVNIILIVSEVLLFAFGLQNSERKLRVALQKFCVRAGGLEDL